MDQRANFLALILLDALEDENESDVYNVLERNSVDPSIVPRERGISPLHYSCGMENEELAMRITKRFLDIGANTNVRSDENMTPLHVAAIYGRLEIVRQLLEHGAQLDIVDDNSKTPVHYAIDECHFEVVQIMRDHIFVNKYAQKQQEQQSTKQQTQQNSLLSQNKFEKSLHQRIASTPNNQPLSSPCTNKHLLAVTQSLDDSAAGKYTPNRINYNYDVTSPYYINITHRRNRVQPKFPVTSMPVVDINDDPVSERYMEELSLSSEVSSQPVNIFTLTKENLQELTQTATVAERSRISLIETWREKVQRSRARQSILKEYDDIGEMIDEVMENEHLNFTNTVLKEKTNNQAMETEIDSGACGSTTSSLIDTTEYAKLPVPPKCGTTTTTITTKNVLPKMSLGKLIQKVAQAHLVDPETEPCQEAESSFKTVPEFTTTSNTKENNMKLMPTASDANNSNFIRSPKSNEYFLQMTEAYVHTDDENGLVFYETRLLSNHDYNTAQQKSAAKETPAKTTANKNPTNMDTTATSQSTNLTIPVDYETDALRAELTTFGEPPGPITKSTKRLYIKRLIKYKRKTAITQELKQKQSNNGTKFSIELHRTTRSLETFQTIRDYMTYETLSMKFFANHQHKKQMREGHLKQSFIYMLIDPRISCNLPGESVFLDKFDIWKRFLQSIFYVGKGKTSRPYSHLYEAMKTHSRIHNIQLNEAVNKNGKKVSIKKQPLNIDLFKSPPKKSSDSQKLDRILNIWGSGHGVVCLHVFHNIVPTEAYTREAAMIEALSLQHLTNVKRGDFYGPAQTWTMKEKKYLGIALLYKAMQIYLAEGESQLSPSDLI